MIAFVADLHISGRAQKGIAPDSWFGMKMVKRIVESSNDGFVSKLDKINIIFGGDIFNKPTLDAQEMKEFRNWVSELEAVSGKPVRAIAGNHDAGIGTAEMFEAFGVHNLVMSDGGNSIISGYGECRVNGVKYCSRQEWEDVHMPRLRNDPPEVLVLHGAYDKLFGKEDCFHFTDETLVGCATKFILIGHIHKKADYTLSDGVRVLSPGSLRVTSLGEKDHGMWLIDTITWEAEWQEIPARMYVDLSSDAPIPSTIYDIVQKSKEKFVDFLEEGEEPLEPVLYVAPEFTYRDRDDVIFVDKVAGSKAEILEENTMASVTELRDLVQALNLEVDKTKDPEVYKLLADLLTATNPESVLESI